MIIFNKIRAFVAKRLFGVDSSIDYLKQIKYNMGGHLLLDITFLIQTVSILLLNITK
jgi:hypothetical protein